MAVISALISAFLSILSMRARSTLRILPRMGRMAWVAGSRARTADPPAESPSTMNSSRRAGSVAVQSLSLSGIPAPSNSDLARMARRASPAAIRAREALTALVATSRASAGCSSSHSASFSWVTRWTSERMEAFPSLDLVWPSNCGSEMRALTMAVRPSRMSSPWRLGSLSLRWPRVRA